MLAGLKFDTSNALVSKDGIWLAGPLMQERPGLAVDVAIRDQSKRRIMRAGIWAVKL